MLQLLGEGGRVIGVDIDIRAHNRAEIEKHPMSRHITLIQGSSIDPVVAQRVKREVGDAERVMVVLDSNHTHEHVLEELRLYSPLVRRGSYLIVLDTAIDDMPPGSFPDRPWGPGNNPKTAVRQFLAESGRFEVDQAMQDKLLITVAPEGFLRCVRD
jgi:cephalosporin hydroxylase